MDALARKGEQQPGARAKLIGADGRQVELPDELHQALLHAVEALAKGYAITIAPHHTTLTTQQAADMLGVSRPTLTKLLETGKIPYERPNSHRKIKLSDLLEYQRRRREVRRQALDELVADGLEMDLDEGGHAVPPPGRTDRSRQ